MYHKEIYLNIGNSFMAAGYFKKTGFVLLKRVPAKRSSFKRLPFLKEKNCGLVVVASVVPSLESAARKILKNRALVLKNISVPVVNLYKNKKTLGIDRLLGSLGGAIRYGSPCLVVDFGTAATLNLTGRRGEFRGGVICPGASLFSEYLFEKTSKLPYVSLVPAKKVIGRSTKECINAGVFYGYVEMISGLIRRMKAEANGKIKVVATGGWGKLFSPFIKEISEYDPYLVFYGMKATQVQQEKQVKWGR